MKEDKGESMQKAIEGKAHEDVALHPTGGYPVCGCRKKSNGEPCLQPAGQKTWHQGVGPCFLHGGASPSGPHSKYLQHDPDIKARIKELKESGDLTDLRSEIAVTVAMLERAVDRLDSAEESPLDVAKAVSTISTNLARVIEISHKLSVGYYTSPEKLELILKILGLTVRNTCNDCDKVLALADAIEQTEIPE